MVLIERYLLASQFLQLLETREQNGDLRIDVPKNSQKLRLLEMMDELNMIEKVYCSNVISYRYRKPRISQFILHSK